MKIEDFIPKHDRNTPKLISILTPMAFVRDTL